MPVVFAIHGIAERLNTFMPLAAASVGRTMVG